MSDYAYITFVLISMLLIAQMLYVGAKSDLCVMYESFKQQFGQRYLSP